MSAAPSAPTPTILSAAFTGEARTLAGVLPAGPPEIGIAGRSNVGKSTLLNRLAARPSLARTSKTPGRTRGLLSYDLAVRFGSGAEAGKQALRLVDFPGYGHAQVSQAERESWRRLVEGFVKSRETLRLFLVLVDARRGVEREELDLLEWLDSLGVPYRLLATKIDKLSASERGLLKKNLPGVPAGTPLLPLSAHSGEGIDRLWAVLRRAIASEASAGGPAPVGGESG
jgi:GTP-binding protein